MNKNIFRIIFNEVRGVFMVVAETVSIRGGSVSKSASSGKHRHWAKLRPLSFSLMAAFGTGIWLAPAQAQVIADPNAPRGQQPNVLSAGNGVPLVNIRTPSAGGVSRNTYSQFDVNAQGVILNNAHNNAKTELGGWVQGNPWLAAGTARVILNEVNSSNPSQLRGYVEVAGDRAQVVIANPAGVTCDGCGFVNATRATLTTGTPILGNGGLEGYRVQGGSVVIEGKGLDGTRSDYTEIIARSVQINAGIWAQGLTVATGNGQFDNSNAMVAPVTAGTPAPSFAIDVSHLGGMYAGKIALIGTEAGVGVRNAGHIGGSAGAVTVSANGRLENAQGATIYGSAGIKLNAADVIENNGSISSQGNMQANSQAVFLNRGTVAAADELSIRASQIDNAKHVIGSVNGSVNLNATAGEVQNTEGRIEAKQDVSIQGAGINNQGGAIIGGNLRLDSSKELNNEKGFLVAQGNLAMTADSLSNKTGLVGAKGQLSLEGNNVLNEDGLFVSEGRIAMAVSQKLDNQGGQIRSQGDIELDASNGEILNDGKNASSLIRSGGVVTIKANSLSNTETKGSGQSLNDQGIDGQSLIFSVSSLNNSKGSIRADDSTLLIVGQKFDNTGGLVSAGKSLLIQDSAAAFSTSTWANALQGKNTDGRLIAGEQMSLSLKELEGAGQILSLGTLTAHIAGDYSNTGTIQANGSLSVSVQGTLNNQSKIQGADSLRVEAEVFDNTSGGEVMSGRETTVIAGNTVTNRGLIDGATTYIDAKLINNLGTGRVYGNDVALTAETLRNESESGKSASIMARNRLDIGVSKLVNAELSNIYSAGNISIGGSLTGERKAVGRAQTVDNVSATIESLGDMAIATDSLSNRNTHFTTKDVVLSTESFVQYQGAGSSNIYSSGAYYEHVRDSFYRLRTPDGGWDNSYRYQYTRTTSETQVATSIPGQILAGGNLTIEADSILNDKSRIIAGGNLQVAALDLVNTELTGSRTVRDYGTFFALLGHQPKGGGNDWTEVRASTYSPAPTVTEIRLSPTDYGGNKANVGTGTQIGSLAVNSVTQSAQNGGSKVVSLANSGDFSSTINSGSLFRPSTTPGATYVMESDPQFANYRTWLSSDYMLQQLSIDPATTQKRLGDGFYEQKLIREQVAQLTGRRFLDGYADDEAQYRSLLEQGAVFAKAHQLVPGVALTDAQMAQLTSDIVWLVEKTVTLPDGSKVQALVPQVYVRLQPGDLDGSGALLAGRNVDINLSQNLANSGTIAGRNVVSLQGQNLANLGGSIIGRDVSLKAVADINNLGGVIAAQDRLALDAGRNLTVASTTHSESTGNSSRTNIDRVAGLYVSNPKGLLLASAKNDITLAAADIRNDGVGGTTVIEAGGNLNLGTVQETYNRSAVFDSRNTYKESKSAEVGTSIQVQGDIALLAGSNFNARSAQVLSDAGTIGVQAQGSINISEGRATASMASDTYTKSKGSWGSKKEVTTRDRSDSDRAISSSFSGERVAMVAGKDLVVQGSNITSTQGTTLAAGNDLTIKAATETTTESHFRDEKNKGLFVGGGSITLGKKQHTVDSQGDGSSALGSLIGATDGNVTLAAGNAYRQIGSDIITPKGNIDISAKRVDIEEARQISRHTQTETYKQSGLTIGVSNPIISAVQTSQQMAGAARKAGDSRMQALAAASTALAAKNAYDAVSAGQNVKDGNLADKAGGISISVSVGSSKSQSTTTQYSNTGAASHLTAGGDITIQAKGGDQDSDLTIRGSQIRAGGNVALGADDEIKLLAGRNDSTQSSQNSSSSGSIGVGFNLGAGSTGFSVNASASKGKGNSNGSDTQWDETLIQAGNKIDLKSGGDTTLKGAIVEGKQIVADIGGNLSIESLQDKSTYDSKRSNSGFSISVPVTGGGSIGGNVSAGKSKIDSNYQSVVEQSGFKAGDNGFQVTVKGDTDLKGAVIASTDKAVEEGKNSFKTDGTLTLVSLDNKASYQGKATGINIGAGVSMDGKLAPGGTSAGTGKDQGSASSTTQSGISGIAGNQDARSGNSGNGIGKIFDAQKVQEKIDAQVQITQMFGQLAPKAVADFAETQARDLKTQAKQESDPEKRAALLAAADKWAEGGAYRILLHTTVGGLAGGDAGALGAGTVATAAPLLSELQEHVTQALKDAGAGDGLAKLAGQLIAQGTAAGIGAAASGGNTAGAAMGLNVDANNRQLHPSEEKWLRENAKKFAAKEGISEQEAMERLSRQALKEVDYLWRAQLADGDDAAAKAFLQTNQTFTNDLGEQQKIFTVTGQQLLRPEMFANTADPAFYKHFVQSGISRDLNEGLLKELKDSGIDIKDNVVNLAKAAKDNPGLVLKAAWTAVFGLPGAIVDSFKETGNAIGEGAAVALNEDLNAKLNAIYGTDVATAQKVLLAIRITTSVTGATGVAKTGTHLTEATAKIVGKKLDEILDQKALDALMKSGGVFDQKGQPLLDMKTLTDAQKGAMGELFGPNTVKKIVPDGEKLARIPGVGETGIDDLYRVSRSDVDYVVVEYKFVGDPNGKGSTRLGITTDGKQGSESWTLGSDRLEKAVGSNVVADAIRDATKLGRTETWVVTTRPDGSTIVQVLDSFGKPKAIDTSKILTGMNLSGARL